MKDKENLYTLRSILIGAFIGTLLGTNIGSYLSTAKKINNTENPQEKIQLIEYFREDYKNSNLISKIYNFGQYVRTKI